MGDTPLKLADRTISSMLWMFTGTSAQTLMTILVTAILARLLSPVQFGLVSASLLVINFSLIFTQSGMGPALVQKNDLNPLQIRSAFTFSVLTGAFTSAVIWLSAPLLEIMLNTHGIVPILRVLSITFTYQGFAVVAESLLQIKLKFREIALIRLSSYIIGYGVVGVTLAYLHFGVWALISAQIVQTSLQSLCNIILQPHPKRFSLHQKSLKELLWFGGGHTLARIGNYFALFGDKFVTARWLGPYALGLYERSYQFMVMPAALIGNVLQQVLFPALSQVHDRDTLLRVFKRSTSIVSLVTFPISVLCVLLAPDIVHFVLGAKWAEATLPFQILAVGMYFRTSYKIADSFTRSVGAVYKRAWVQWVYALLVFGACIAAQRWGITGISVAVLVALIVNYLLMINLSIGLLSYSWKQYVNIHRSGAGVGVLAGVVTLLDLSICRTLLHLNSITTLVVSLSSVFVIGFALVNKFPGFFLGEEGQWLVTKLKLRYLQKTAFRKEDDNVSVIVSKAGE
jgi:O-antigen/teichoic acid export membrane protein